MPVEHDSDRLTEAHDRLIKGETWATFCDGLARLGMRIHESDFPSDERARAEGSRYLTRLLVYALRMELEFADPLHPAFFRYEDPWTQWGGPNADNVYQRATIDSSGTYRIELDATGVSLLLLSLHEGDMQLGEYGVYGERSLDELEVGAEGQLEIVISPEEHAGNWIQSHPDARLVMIRQYQSDWVNDAIAVPFIERLDEYSLPGPPKPAELDAGFGRALEWVQRSLTFWNDWVARSRQNTEANTLGAPVSPPGGADNIAYGGGHWDLGEDDALLITCEKPDADYWSVQMHTPAWFESGDFASRQTSLNNAQTYVDVDGQMRIVVSHRDPGVPNWIDTENRPKAMLAYRWVRARTKPTPTASVVSLAELREHLPSTHPVVDADQRRTILRSRRRAALARYR